MEGLGRVLTPEQFGAVGDGSHDDTAALQMAMASVERGQELVLAEGRIYRHTAVLTMAAPGASLTGTGTLLATREAKSAVYLAARDLVVDGPTFAMSGASRRWDSYAQMKLRLGDFPGITVRHVTIQGSAAAGIYVGGSDDFMLRDVTVRGTQADAIHITGGATQGTVSGARVSDPGDDGIAVVSYRDDGAPVRHISITQSRVRGQSWGRGLAVVGGSDITIRKASVTHSAGACIYVAAEQEFDTFGVEDVLVDGASLTDCNQQAAVRAADRPSPSRGRIVHGAVMVYNSQPNQSIRAISMRHLLIRDTDPDAYEQVRVNRTSVGSISAVDLSAVRVFGGPKWLLGEWGTDPSDCRTARWLWDGRPVSP